MIHSSLRLLLRLVIGLSLCSLSFAESEGSEGSEETVYVRDTLYVPLRNGPSIEYRIIHQGLKSGTVLTRLERDEKSGFSQVRTQKDVVGWMASQYLERTPGASVRIIETEHSLTALEAKYKDLQTQLSKQSEAQKIASNKLSQLQLEKNALSQDLENLKLLSADVISIDQRNNQLAGERDVLAKQADDLLIENELLNDKSAQAWFLRGAAAIVLGLLLGFLVSKRMYQKAGGGWR